MGLNVCFLNNKKMPFSPKRHSTTALDEEVRMMPIPVELNVRDQLASGMHSRERSADSRFARPHCGDAAADIVPQSSKCVDNHHIWGMPI